MIQHQCADKYLLFVFVCQCGSSGENIQKEKNKILHETTRNKICGCF